MLVTRKSAAPGDQGQVLVIFALFLVVLLAFAALTIDVGAWLVSKRTYQNLADAAALAGAASFDEQTASAAITANQQAARVGAWTSLKDQLGLPIAPNTQGATSTAAATPYSWNGYQIWVASPPSAAGAQYTGAYGSNQRAVFVRVQRPNDAYLSRVVGIGSEVVSAWASAARSSSSNKYAIELLRPRDAAGPSSVADLRISGTGSGISVSGGGVGSNWGLNIDSQQSQGLIISGATDRADLADYTCTNNLWNCAPATTGGVWDGASPGTAKPPQPLPLALEDPGYPKPSLTDTTLFPSRGSFTCSGGGGSSGTESKTWTFTGSAEGLTEVGTSAGIAFGYNSNTVRFTSTTRMNGAGQTESARGPLTSSNTWQSVFGSLPGNTTVVSVELTGGTLQTTSNTNLSSHSATISLVTTSGTQIAVLGTVPSTSSPAVGTVSITKAGAVSVPAAYRAQGTVVGLQIDYHAVTGNSANITAAFDNLAVTITYGSSGCPSATSSDLSTVDCAASGVNVIPPGTYTDIAINSGCAILDPNASILTGQARGMYHVTHSLSIANSSFLIGDGVTLFVDDGATISLGTKGGLVLNTNNGTGRNNSTINYGKAAWTTAGASTWSSAGVYNDAASGSGITLYFVPGTSNPDVQLDGSTGDAGVQFRGYLYAPRRNVSLGGNLGQHETGQIIAWTLWYHGTSILRLAYSGIDTPVVSPPYLVEPTLGQ